MALTKTRVKINTKKLYNALLKETTELQTFNLIEYAKEETKNIGDMIKTYSGGHHMDDTHNLLDSLCWGVSYKGKLEGFGFYREKQASEVSFLHAWSERTVPVDGRAFAEEYIQKYAASYLKGWRIFWGIFAPYWGYWEKGFKMKIKTPSYQEGDAVNYRFMQFSVLTQRYDEIKKVLVAPVEKRIKIRVSTYENLDKPYD